MRWWRLLTVPLAALVVVGCGVGGGRGPSATSTAVVVPPAPVRAGPLVGAVPSGDLATELDRLDRRTLAPLPGARLRLEGTWPMLAVDLRARRVVHRQRFDGAVQGYARLPHGLAMLAILLPA